MVPMAGRHRCRRHQHRSSSLLVDEEGRSFRVAKAPSTPADQSDGVLKGLEAGGIPISDHRHHPWHDGRDRFRAGTEGRAAPGSSRRGASATSSNYKDSDSARTRMA